MTDEQLKILSFDLIKSYIKACSYNNTYSEQAMYVKGVVDSYTTIAAYIRNKEEEQNAGTN